MDETHEGDAMAGYGQFCPVAKAMELLDERWTLLVIREMLMGSRHFNEIRRGVPKMSPALLTKRLRRLERAGLVSRGQVGRRTTYDLTAPGRELYDVVNRLGLWGLRWISDLGDDDLDPHLLMWDMRRTLPVQRWPSSRTTLSVTFSDVDPQARHWWIVVADGEADVCDVDPGYEVLAAIETDLRTMTRIWRGDESWSNALRTGAVRTSGPRTTRRDLPRWLGESTLAQQARGAAAPAREPAAAPAT
ncbi:winged helix-turn-helix transcriptional regulator [Cumulibacter manganitolerans]|uniref:winged helix-turn-helix transcriptional regulator n=1 Tax=Cumulibacter manganitolerans TaxID=1884992 RepID=UPI001E455EE9|nr:helix-turn-helix domain-containing protein [Cumulibacter manganitolerans]